MTCEKLRRVHVRPEAVVLAKRNLDGHVSLAKSGIQVALQTDLQIHGVRSMPLSCKHRHCVMEYVAASLDSLVQPARSELLLVDIYREGLPAAVAFGFDEGNIKLVG